MHEYSISIELCRRYDPAVQGESDIAGIAQLIGDHSRAAMLLELMGGRSLRASELAACAGVSRATASFHLGRLLDAEILQVHSQGRGRLYSLAGDEVAQAIEALQRIAPRHEARSLATVSRAHALAHARFCYDHLAGVLAIQIADALTARKLIELRDDTFEPTGRGERWLAELRIDIVALRAKRRSFARACLDWSERRPHIAGALGAAVAQRFLDLEWISRSPNGRAVTLTSTGRAALAEMLAIEI